MLALRPTGTYAERIVLNSEKLNPEFFALQL
jgi:hypothetical protein